MVHFKKYHANEKEILKYAFSTVSDHDNFLFVFEDALIVTIWGFFGHTTQECLCI